MSAARPGQASVQYGDLRGEVATDLWEDVGRSVDLQAIPRELGIEGVKGRIVALSVSLNRPRKGQEPDRVSITFQTACDTAGTSQINDEIQENNGTLLVNE